MTVEAWIDVTLAEGVIGSYRHDGNAWVVRWPGGGETSNVILGAAVEDARRKVAQRKVDREKGVRFG